jgi:ribosome-associated heat shock protein Hsp15
MSRRNGQHGGEDADDDDDSHDGQPTAHAGAGARQRLDKWLWAARFFRTRAQAKQEVGVGDIIHVRRGDEQFVVQVRGLSEQRGGAPAAQLLYAETDASKAAREANREQRRRGGFGMIAPPNRPTKRDRRALDRLHEAPSEDERR